VHPSGEFLYASNRGDDSIVLVKLDDAGRMTFRARTSAQGKVPRYFAFDPTGHWLLVPNQGSDTVMVFAVNLVSGELTPCGTPVPIAKPGGIVFVGG
jgi:6-phosphogluconolactonase